MLQLISETNKQEDGHKGSMRGRRQRSHTDVLKGDQLKNLHHYATTGEIQPLLLNANTSGQEQTQHFIQKLKRKIYDTISHLCVSFIGHK